MNPTEFPPTDIDALLLDDPECDNYMMIRELLIAIPSFPDSNTHLIASLPPDTPRPPLSLITTLRDLNRESLTDLALRLTLCPLHLIDYAICFDDDDAECAAIRSIHPTHDT